MRDFVKKSIIIIIFLIIILSKFQNFPLIDDLFVCFVAATNLQDKLLIDVSLCNAGLEVRVLQEAQEKLVNELQD